MELKYLDSFKCYRILTDCRGFPLGAGGWVDEGGGGYGCVGGILCLNACTCMHTHTHTHMHVKHDQQGCLHVGGHLQFLYMYTCACVCVCVHVHACVCMWEHPPCLKMPPDTPTHLAPPQSHREPKIPNLNNS